MIAALQALRGVARVTAVTIVAEVGELLALCDAAPADGLQRRGGQRRFQRRADAARRDHEDRAMRTCGESSSKRRGRIATAPPWAPRCGKRQAARQCRGESDRVEGAASLACALSALRAAANAGRKS